MPPCRDRQLPLQVPVEILMRPQGFQIHQAHGVFTAVAQKVQLAIAAKFVYPQLRQVAFFAFARIGVDWFKWQLKGDRQAALMFEGPDCTLCKSPTWYVQRKNIK